LKRRTGPKLSQQPQRSRRQFLKHAAVAAGALALGGTGLRLVTNQIGRDYDVARTAVLLDSIAAPAPGQVLPNIVVILTDDLGYGDLGCYGNTVIATPHIDRLAEHGVRLTDFYASAPLCSPSRAGLFSGRYPIRTHVTLPLYPAGSVMDLAFRAAGVRRYGVAGIAPDEALLPKMLQRRGYRTGLVGKWHLGDRSPHLPNENGFDAFFGAYYSNSTEPYAIYRNRDIEIPAPADQNTLTRVLTREARAFITESADQPFFLAYAQPFPHVPLHASPAFRGSSHAGLYGDVIQEIDWSVGQVLETLDATGLANSTLVIFTSDNGPWWQGNPGFTRGRKNLPFDGGYRVPCIARWPGIVPEGQSVAGMSMNFDIYATCLSAARIPLPADRITDGRDMLPLLRGQVETLHDTLYYYKGNRLIGVRHGSWKYMRRHMTDNGGYASLQQGPFLFNLATDPNESYSLIESEPDTAARLVRMLNIWDAQLEQNLRGWL
jgi:arylsulfatase A